MNSRKKLLWEIIRLNIFHPWRIWNAAWSFLLPHRAVHRALPVSVDIEPTIACNLSCVMCHRRELASRRTHMTMSLGEFMRIIDQLPSVLKLNLQGMGEPMLTRDFFDMVRYAKKKGIVVTTVTNGNLLFPERAKEAVESGLNRIYFSIDTLDESQYRAYRPGGDVSTVKKNLEWLMRERKKNKNSALEVGIWMLLFRDNISQLIPMIRFAKDIGVDELAVNMKITYRGKNAWRETIERMQARKENEIEEIIKKAQKEALRLGVKVSFLKGMGFMKSNPASLCQWPWKSLYITSEGDVSPCCIIADPHIASLGNIHREGIKKIWNGASYRELRKKLLSGNVPEYCKECYRKNLTFFE